VARWGQVEINTSQFSKDVEQFCSKNIRPRVASQIDIVYDSIAAVLANKVISIIKKHFDSWKSRTHITVDKMQSSIDSEIKNLLQEKNLSRLFGNEISPILTKIANELRADIKGLESKYGIPIGNLGNSFDLGKAAIGNLSLGSQTKIDTIDGMMSGVGSIIGWISGILATVVALVVGPTIVSITTWILAIILIVLGNLIAGILLATPIGWVALGAFGITVTVAGASVKKVKEAAQEAVKDNMPSWDIPVWVRNRVNSSSVYSNIDEQRKVIIAQVTSKLKEDDKIRQELTDKIISVFEKSLKEKAEEMRALIG
jgi:hypothetical protein